MAARRRQHVSVAASAMNAASVSSPPAPLAPSAPPAPLTTPRALRGDDDDDDEEEDDEGDAPEEISQGVARDRAMRSLKEAEDSRKKEKADVKEKRRHKHELYKEQKKRKMLSEDILKAVDEAKSRKAAGPTKAKLSGHHDNDDDDDDEEQESGKEEEESAPAVENRKKPKRGSSCYRVVRLRDEGLGAQKREEAQSFLQQRLYGQGRQRVSANEFFSLRNKTGACKKPALQFVKDGGAGMNKKDRKKRKREQAKMA
ncbi:nucleolar protein 7 [Lethenteron reissneri]|uniref:nucleolar protein 7 n=1 Tax=Lethenteron reissneri TaxID=7753 RepID=UPI002AB6A91D|nr:nucleolar protein 7 [Lethenteron reissneri]